MVPEDAVVGGYYFQAINIDAPHPNAARLWQEFLYSDEGQNLWLAGGARPVRADAMVKRPARSTPTAYAALPPVEGYAGLPDRRTSRSRRRSTSLITGPTPSADRDLGQGTQDGGGEPRARTVPRLRHDLLGRADGRRDRQCLSRRQQKRLHHGCDPGVEVGRMPTSRLTKDTVILSVRDRAVIGAVVRGVGRLHSRFDRSRLTACSCKVVVRAASGVLAKFGGVALAFAFIATVGRAAASVSGWHSRKHQHRQVTDSTWLFSLTGLKLVYCYFQIPLMIIVFLPALDGIRPQWREAADNLGASTWQYWRHVGAPLLLPGIPRLVAVAVRQCLRGLRDSQSAHQPGVAHPRARESETRWATRTWPARATSPQAIALEMVVIVAIVMFAYSRLERRTSGWLRSVTAAVRGPATSGLRCGLGGS